MTAGSALDERPRQLLIVEERATIERVAEMGIEGVGVTEGGVEASLHHAGAAGAADGALRDDRDRERRIRCRRGERAQEACATAPDDRDVRLDDGAGAQRQHAGSTA